MDPDRELELKEAVASVANRYNVGGYAFLYLDDKKMKLSGELGLSALAPLLMDYIMSKFGK